MYVYFWATQSMNQEFKLISKRLKTVKTKDFFIVELLNSKLGNTLHVLVTSANILTAKRTLHFDFGFKSHVIEYISKGNPHTG